MTGPGRQHNDMGELPHHSGPAPADEGALRHAQNPAPLRADGTPSIPAGPYPPDPDTIVRGGE
jgi:hypothetical protein